MLNTACLRFDEKNEVGLDKALEYSIGSRNVLWWHCDEAHRLKRGMPAPPYEQTIKRWISHGCMCNLCYEESRVALKRDRQQRKKLEATLKKQALIAAASAAASTAAAPAAAPTAVDSTAALTAVDSTAALAVTDIPQSPAPSGVES